MKESVEKNQRLFNKFLVPLVSNMPVDSQQYLYGNNIQASCGSGTPTLIPSAQAPSVSSTSRNVGKRASATQKQQAHPVYSHQHSISLNNPSITVSGQTSLNPKTKENNLNCAGL